MKGDKVMNRNAVRKKKRRRPGNAYIAAAFCAAGLSLGIPAPLTALADSPPFAYSEEKWASLRDNKLEFDEIADLIHEYNSTVKKNAIEYQDYKGKDSEERSEEHTSELQSLYS